MTMQTTYTDEDGVEIRVEANGSNQVRLVVTHPDDPEDPTMFDFLNNDELHAFVADILTVTS